MKCKPIALSLLLVTGMIGSLPAQQSFASYRQYSVNITSDSNARTVILSNLLEDKPGGNPAYIGAARWTEDNRDLECRSLLAFDFQSLGLIIKPDQLVNAQLVLTPIHLNKASDNPLSFEYKIMVKRIAQTWEDTSVTWLKQPLTDEKNIALKKISQDKMNKPVKINVTEQVKNMLRYGNNGFMINYQEGTPAGEAIGQWFASSTCEDKEKRPVLLLDLLLPDTGAPVRPDPSPLPALAAEQQRSRLVVVPGAQPPPPVGNTNQGGGVIKN